jgi:DNA-binding MarR family transcriptional regulator
MYRTGTSGKFTGQDSGRNHNVDVADHSISIIEIELLTLVRLLETLGRKSSLYLQVDRSGYLALRMLERLGPMPTTTLADALQLDASTVTRQVNTLVSSGFAQRLPNPTDKRSSQLAITAAGQLVMGEVERGRRRVLRQMFDGWDEEERHTLGEILTKLNFSLIDQVERTNQLKRA